MVFVTLSQLIKTYPSYSKAYFQRGRSYQGLDDYLNAEKDYQNAIVLDKNNPNAFYNFGTLRFLQKDYNGAIQYFTQCLLLDDENINAYNDRGSAYRMNESYAKALADYETVVRKNPKLAFVLNNIGTTKTQNERLSRSNGCIQSCDFSRSEFSLGLQQ